MKYDSGMAHFKNDIIAAIKKLLTGDKKITKKFKAEDRSLAPLQEYLKEQYGKAYLGYRGDGVGYNCRSTGMILRFDTILNNPGDKELTLSWSQVAKFIRDNWDEIFSITPKSSYREALKKELPQLTDKMIDKSCSCCPGHFFDGDSVPYCTNCDENMIEEVCSKCWNKPCEGTYNGEPFDPSDWEDELSGDQQVTSEEPEKIKEKQPPTEPDKALPEQAAKISETFNYSVLSTELGDFLKHKEQQLKNEYFNFIAKWGEIFADAQETLAKHGFGENNGIFEKWFKSLNLPISRRTMYRMISVYKFRSCQIGTNEEALKIFDEFPKTSQYEIADGKVSDNIIRQVANGDIKNHEEYIALKKQLEKANEKAEFFSNAQQDALKENQQLRGDRNNAMTKITNLEKQIKELEKRPIDVAVQTDEAEIERRAAEYAQGIIRSKELEKENRQLKKEISEAGHTELDDCFSNSSGTSADEEMLSDIYETLHGKVLSALGDCAYFIRKDGLPETVKNKAVSRFESISETLESYIDELEEN